MGLGATGDGVVIGTALLGVDVAAGDTIRVGGALYGVKTGAAKGAAVSGLVLWDSPATAVGTLNATALSAMHVSVQGQEQTAKVWHPTLDTINISAHSIDIYKEFPAAFFNNYTTYHYGGPNINAPKDTGSLFIPFCLYPGTYQPSGHINVSRAREFYLTYNSTFFASGISGQQNGLPTGADSLTGKINLPEYAKKCMLVFVHISV
jgi:hypothetical protein